MCVEGAARERMINLKCIKMLTFEDSSRKIYKILYAIFQCLFHIFSKGKRKEKQVNDEDNILVSGGKHGRDKLGMEVVHRSAKVFIICLSLTKVSLFLVGQMNVFYNLLHIKYFTI
jgi:hypothetical protein